MSSVEHLQTLILDLPPSCIEFWPLNPQYAVVGTYNLEKPPEGDETNENPEDAGGADERKAQERNGSIILLRVIGDEVKIIQTESTPFAVLDIHFTPKGRQQSFFGVATSRGSIVLYQLTDEDGNGVDSNTNTSVVPKVAYIQKYIITDPSLLVTAFLWHSKAVGKYELGLVTCSSLTSGQIAIGELESPKTIQPSREHDSIGEHSLEAWTVALTPDSFGIYSGGDDSALSFWNFADKVGDSLFDFSSMGDSILGRMEWTDRKIHGAGVTAILPLITEETETLLLTGSYDDHIRLISAPFGGRRRVLAEMNLDGGVWRLKRLDGPLKDSATREEEAGGILLLASCMHAGARIVKLAKDDSGEWHFEVLAKFEEHKSMNYGSDSQPALNTRGQRTFITTSFYDRLLCLWRY